jgi:hypothetical protein
MTSTSIDLLRQKLIGLKTSIHNNEEYLLIGFRFDIDYIVQSTVGKLERKACSFSLRKRLEYCTGVIDNNVHIHVELKELKTQDALHVSVNDVKLVEEISR